jgi:hypothetical protein
MTRKRLSQAALDYFREQGAKGGKIGGPAAAANMTAAHRKARATKASLAAAAARSEKTHAKQEHPHG